MRECQDATRQLPLHELHLDAILQRHAAIARAVAEALAEAEYPVRDRANGDLRVVLAQQHGAPRDPHLEQRVGGFDGDRPADRAAAKRHDHQRDQPRQRRREEGATTE